MTRVFKHEGIWQRIGYNIICRQFNCKCGQTVHKLGLHPLSCGESSARYFRHTEMDNINILRGELGSIDIPAKLGPILV